MSYWFFLSFRGYSMESINRYRKYWSYRESSSRQT